MLRISIVMLIVFGLWSTNNSADTRYRGLILAHIVDANGDVFRGYQGTSSDGTFENKQVIYFEQTRGQKLTSLSNTILIDNSKKPKYHMVFDIVSNDNESFQAELSFFENSMVYNKKTNDYGLVSKIIKKKLVDGMLNAENNFSFIDDNKPNLKISINIDRVFEKEEILKRLSEKLAVKRE